MAIAQSVLRTKTNFQLPPTALAGDNNNNNNSYTNASTKKKSSLARTFSNVLESNNNNSTSSAVPSTPVVSSDSRRLSLTKRGSAKTRLVVHKDDPEPATVSSIKTNIGTSQNITTGGGGGSGGGAGGEGATTSSQRPTARLVKAVPLESATTFLSIERALESEDQVVVGHAEAETKRRALTNEEDKLEIEYCPPPIEGEYLSRKYAFFEGRRVSRCCLTLYSVDTHRKTIRPGF